MIKSLSVPEKLFQFAMWVISFLFAGFLIGLGGKVVGDLPGVETRVTIDQFLDQARVQEIAAERRTLRAEGADHATALERARLSARAASNAYQARRASFDNWIATRTATTDARQDPDVLARTRELDTLKAVERRAGQEVELLESRALAVTERMDALDREMSLMREAASGRYERARFWQELKVFLIRLALTLPLLVLAGWLTVRKRGSQYWPLARGFVLFAIFVFFVELVPYLPSYGGYVRYAVGAIATAVAGVYVTRAMRRYLARRAEVEQQGERERRRSLGYEEAVRRMAAGVCPGCERAITSGPAGATTNFCVHCGMTLFDACGACGTRKNAFFQYCHSCGSPAESAPAAGPPPGTSPLMPVPALSR
jgi:hypothetical protein